MSEQHFGKKIEQPELDIFAKLEENPDVLLQPEIVNDIENVPDAKIFEVLNVIKNYKKQHNIPQEVVDVCIDKIAHVARILYEKKADANMTRWTLSEMIATFSSYDTADDITITQDEPLLSEKALVSIQDHVDDCPELTRIVWNKVFQNGLLLRTQKMLDIVKQVNADVHTPQDLKQYIANGLSESLQYRTDASVLYAEQLARDNSEGSFYSKYEFLKLLNTVKYLSATQGATDQAFHTVGEMFGRMIEGNNNTFLSTYVQRIGDQMAYIQEASDTMFVAHTPVFEFTDVQQFEEHQYGTVTLSERYTGLYNIRTSSLEHILDNDTGAEVSIPDITSVVSEEVLSDSAKEERRKTNLDFQALADPVFREVVEEYFNIELKEYDIRTQMWFMKFLATKTEKEFEAVKSFVDTYKVDGLKTFISLEYAQDNGDKILETATQLEELGRGEEVKRLFEKFGALTQEIEKTSVLLRNEGLSEEIKEVYEFISQLHEALIRRSTDLLIAMHHIVTEEPAEFNSSDIINCIEGISTLLNTVSGLKNGQSKAVPEQIQHIKTEHDESFSYPFFVEHEDGHQYRLRVFVRPESSSQGQARMMFSLSFAGKDIEQENEVLKTTFENTTEFNKPNKFGETKRESHELVIRVDYDEERGEVSLDMGRGHTGQGKTIKERSGDRLGNLLEVASSLGAHNTESFSEKFAKREQFKQVTEPLLHYLDKVVSGN